MGKNQTCFSALNGSLPTKKLFRLRNDHMHCTVDAADDVDISQLLEANVDAERIPVDAELQDANVESHDFVPILQKCWMVLSSSRCYLQSYQEHSRNMQIPSLFLTYSKSLKMYTELMSLTLIIRTV